ncbi:MAG: MCE family protein [Burkholderiales bacterium]|nr:MCE family protein [Burkholderiales bacterium]
MENRAHALAAGLFTLVLGAALAAVALWFNKDDIKLIPYVMTTLSPVTGLKVEAPVRYRGVDVGKVEDISIDAGKKGRVQIRIGVREGTPITSGTYAQLGYQGITGLAYVLLGDDGKSTHAMPSSPDAITQIRMKPSLMDDGEVLFASFTEIAEKINRLLSDENQGHVRRTLAGVEEVTQRAGVVTRKLEPTLQALPGLIAEAKNLAVDARASIKKADHFIGSANGLALKLDQRVDTLAHAVASVETSVNEAGSTARAVNEETVPRVNALVDDLAKETHALGRVINTLGEQPQSIVFGTPPGRPGPGEPGFTGGK